MGRGLLACAGILAVLHIRQGYGSYARNWENEQPVLTERVRIELVGRQRSDERLSLTGFNYCEIRTNGRYAPLFADVTLCEPLMSGQIGDISARKTFPGSSHPYELRGFKISSE